MPFTVPSTWEWFVIIIDRTTGTEIQQDVTRWVDLTRSNFRPTTSDKSNQANAHLSFPWTTALNIRELMEVWAGWRDKSSQRPVKAWFGGYIQKQTGTQNGGEHIMDLELIDYGILLTNTEVRGWPTLPPGYEVMPVNVPLGDWIAGGGLNPYQGIIPAHLQHVSVRIDNAYAGFVLPPWAIPGNADNYPGRWGYCSLRKILEDMADVTKFIDPVSRPSFWMRAVAANGRIIPQLQWVELNGVNQAPVMQFAVDANEAAGEARPEMPVTHERDARPVRTRVTVKGVGSDPTTGQIIEGVTYLINHANRYPTYYQVQPGWSGAPIVDLRIVRQDRAQLIADAIETQVWGALGMITFNTDYYVEPGQFVGYRDVQEGLDVIQPITEVTINTNPGRPVFTVKIGRQPLDINDILRGGTTDQPLLEGDAGWKTGGAGVSGTPAGRGGSAGVPGMPRNSQAPITRVAVHDLHNVLTPQYNDVTAFTLQASGSYPPDPVTGLPPPSPPAPTKNLAVVKDRLDNERNWYGPDGTDHPHHYTIPLVALGDFPVMIPDPCRLTVLRVAAPDGTVWGGVAVSLLLNGVAVPTPTNTSPLVCARYDVLTVSTTGTLPTGGAALLLSEAPDVTLP
jgi:hypothetical protein